MATRHRLQPNHCQYFFITALQGGQYGDPRPYRLSVEAGRNVRIESCTRIDLSDWKKLPVSMVFAADDDQPGSPAAPADNSTFSQDVPATLPSTVFDPVARQRQLMAMPWQPTAHLAAATRALDHLLGRDPVNGAWWLAANNGESCLGRVVAELDPAHFGPDAQIGDFNGDSASDLVAWDRKTGSVQVAVFQGTAYECRDWASWPATEPGELLVGDFNGDGLDDILVADRQHRQWQAGISRGNRFEIESRGTYDGDTDKPEFLVGDFTGDGRSDLVERSPGVAQRPVASVWRSIAAASALIVEDWGTWSKLDAGSPLHPAAISTATGGSIWPHSILEPGTGERGTRGRRSL